ncbi:MAG: 3-hydroxybutyryl-CoA dehydrogenase [Candidatus Sericytochromatia bacterium]|nr:MAG: 3-hydroxybutyryl-CoA dehydrogenase [Candidatus Sericytochromatia bacterium]
MNIEKVFVAGSGLMGSGIAHAVAFSNKKVILYDISEQAIEKALKSINKILDKQLEKGIISQDKKDNVLNNIETTRDLLLASSCNLVIEAIVENIDLKKELFSKLDNICSSNVIFASNTSSLPITKLARATKRTDKFIGMHFFSPVDRMKLIEIIRGYDTSDETFNIIKDFSLLLGKEVSTSKDYPGFITTRLGLVLMNEAVFCLYEGVGTVEDIDKGMKLGYNHPIGPLALADAIGLDICLSILDIMYEEYKDPKYRACPLLRQMVNAGHLGKKTGKGFYNYQ